jgi:hypothetical protein
LEGLSLLSPRSAPPHRCGPVAQWIERQLTSLRLMGHCVALPEMKSGAHPASSGSTCVAVALWRERDDDFQARGSCRPTFQRFAGDWVGPRFRRQAGVGQRFNVSRRGGSGRDQILIWRVRPTNRTTCSATSVSRGPMRSSSTSACRRSTPTKASSRHGRSAPSTRRRRARPLTIHRAELRHATARGVPRADRLPAQRAPLRRRDPHRRPPPPHRRRERRRPDDRRPPRRPPNAGPTRSPS